MTVVRLKVLLLLYPAGGCMERKKKEKKALYS
jgi:hypothetical protein